MATSADPGKTQTKRIFPSLFDKLEPLDQARAGYKWMVYMGFSLLATLICYGILHLEMPLTIGGVKVLPLIETGKIKLVQLDVSQVTELNSYLDVLEERENAYRLTNYKIDSLDSELRAWNVEKVKKDTIALAKQLIYWNEKRDDAQESKEDFINFIQAYYSNTFSNIDPEFLHSDLNKILSSANPVELKKLLPKYQVKTTSNFYLFGNWVFMEIFFWCLIGVFCNLIYNTSERLRKAEFNKKEIYVHVGKLLYSPPCAVVIYLCYDMLTESSSGASTAKTESTVAISFLLGFFSGRMMDLLNRIKDILLPFGTDKKEEMVYSISGKISLPDECLTKVTEAENKLAELESASEPNPELIAKAQEDLELERRQIQDFLLKGVVKLVKLPSKEVLFTSYTNSEGDYKFDGIASAAYQVVSEIDLMDSGKFQAEKQLNLVDEDLVGEDLVLEKV